MTDYPNGLSVYGAPVGMGGGLPLTKGKYLFVDYGIGSDGNKGTMKKPLKTVQRAYELATTNNDDVIVLMGSSTHTLTAMLDISKNRIHFVGLDGTYRRLGQNAKISLGVTTAATDIATVKNTGVRNTFHNIKFINNNTVNEGIYCFAEGGEYTVFESCEFYKSTDLDVTGAAEILLNGDTTQFRGCYIGSTVDAISGAVIRPCVLMTREVLTGKVSRDVLFDDCIFARKFGNTANRFIYGAGATDIERMMVLNNCTFIGAKLSTAIPAQNIAFGSSLTDGDVLLKNCTSIRASTAFSTTTGVFTADTTPDATGAAAGIAIQCA